MHRQIQESLMDDAHHAFTVTLPELRKFKTAGNISGPFFLLFWILLVLTEFGTTGIPSWLGFTVTGIVLALSTGFSIYGSRKRKQLAPVINRRFAEEFTARTGYEYPQDVDILSVKRTIAVRSLDGSVFLWGIRRAKDAVNVFPTT
ncbi:hypothetical protein [Arthrobacter bambusae]|uniref:hypothetical protein n=1 Tax=Arthrobacter bambusae TaxID=1338426 RepID=UPI0027892585|nr:hypothetical protein [Arthrobacter bambusae]MDQ0239276.1 hypothetical protein [Arthrobacter bambusae]